ncbi:MAG: hypothetical protein AB7L92_03900 [Alphaproteobacteria bacterium]
MEEYSQDTRPQRETPSVAAKALKLLSFPIAAISGFWVAKQRIYKDAYENARDTGFLKGLAGKTGERTQKMQEIAREALERIENGETVEVLKKTRPLNKEINEKIAKRMQSLGLGNIRQQWDFTRPDQKHAAAIEFITVAGISIGALLAVAHFMESRAAQDIPEGYAR